MRKIRIAILDSGIEINVANSYLSKTIIESYKLVEYENFFDITNCNIEDSNGHGTACFMTINSVYNDAEFVIINILNRKGVCSAEKLIAALKFITTIDVDIVNMSISLDDKIYIDEISLLTEILYKQRKFIIASKSNDRCTSIPAQLRYAYGVEKFSGPCGLDYVYYPHRKINIICDGTPSLMPRNCPIHFFGGNSKATALMTGIVAKYMSSDSLIEGMSSLICNHSVTELHSQLKLSHQNKMLTPTACRRFYNLIGETATHNQRRPISYILHNAEMCYNLIDLANMFFGAELLDENFNAFDFTSVDTFLTKVDELILKK